ncbi:thiamine transporter membrane protein [Providencia alcalifaciens]|nr:thiamine transporter membrane protein [Providencia alcalifaciens]
MLWGGGPAATTIELAIYQALSYDFDLGRATLLALIQLGCCVGLMLICQHINHAFSIGFSHQNQWFDPADNLFRRLRDLLVIAAALLLLIPPLLAVIVDGLNSQLLDVLQQSALWQATSTSLFIALFAGVICVILTLMLLWSSRELRLRNALKLGTSD